MGLICPSATSLTTQSSKFRSGNTITRTDLGQWLYQSSFCLWASRGAAGAAFGRVWDPPLQKTKPFRVCRRGRTLVGPPGNGTRLGRAAQCAAPTKKRERSGISVGAGPRPARGRTLCAPTVETVCPYNQGRSLIRHGFAAPPSPKGEGRGMGLPKPSPLGEGAPEGGG